MQQKINASFDYVKKAIDSCFDVCHLQYALQMVDNFKIQYKDETSLIEYLLYQFAEKRTEIEKTEQL